MLSLLAVNQPLLAGPPFPTDVTILRREDFIGRNYFSVADALERAPSVDLERHGARGTRAVAKIRGVGSAKRVLISIDGLPLTHEFDAEVDLSQIPINAVERIEITRGGAPVAYGGNAIGGAINVVTSRPQQQGLDTRLGTGVGRDGVKHHHGRFLGRSNLGDLTYLTSREESGGYLFNERSENDNHFANISRSFNGKGFWGAEYYYLKSQVGLSQGTLLPLEEWNRRLEREPADPNAERRQESQNGKIIVVGPETKAGTFTGSLRQSFQNTEDRAVRQGPALRDQKNRATSLDLTWKESGTEAGVRRRDLKRDLFPLSANRANEQGVYALHTWSKGPWTARPGLRYDHHSHAGGFLSPRLAVIFSPGDDLSLSATASRAGRAPSFDELFPSSGTVGNANLNYEKGESFDIGAALHPNRTYSAQVTAFFTRTKDLINAGTNRGTEKTKGVEIEGSVTTGPERKFPHASLRGHWTVQRSQRDVTGPGFKDTAMTPRHLARAALEQYCPLSITLANELRYESERFERDDRQGRRLPGFTVWNIHLGVKILKADLYFDVENVTQRRTTEALATGFIPQADRTYWGGVSIRFEN